MKSKKLKGESNDEESFETQDVGTQDGNLNKKSKKKSKKQKDKIEEVPKRPLIELIDEELNKIEYCNLNDFTTDAKKVNFDGTNKYYFQTFFIDKLIDSKLEKQNTLNLSAINLNDELLADVVDMKNLIKNENFIFEVTRLYPNGKEMSDTELLNTLMNYFNNIELLDLSENKLARIPFELIKLFQNLKRLKLNDNQIRHDLNEAFEKDENLSFKTIEYLNIENNKLDNNLNFLSLFKSLRYLNISNNFISNLNLNQLVALFPKLVDLNVSSNHQVNDQKPTASEQTFSKNDSIEHLNLKKLNLRNMNLNNLIYNISGFRNVEYLILDENNLEFIPTQLYELDRLKVLSMNFNKLTEISEKFCLKTKFKTSIIQLNLNNNLIQNENFSEKFYIFKNLLKLDLSGNKLRYIPNALPESLRELRISNNRILTLMIRPVRLLLNMSITTITADDDLDGLELLRQRLLNSTAAYTPATQQQQLQYSTVFYLRNLEYLDLSSNQLQELPHDFGLLNVSLRYLNLSSNLIKQLDIKLCCRGLYNLKYLNLSSNFIKFIPEQICEFKQLEYLYLNHNSIQFLNFELCNELNSLIELDLSFNQINELPIFAHKAGKIQAITLTQALSALHNTQQNQEFELGQLFTFSLKNLKKVNLNSNKIHNVFPFTIVFSQCSGLVEVNLSNNLITGVKFDNENRSGTASADVPIQLSQYGNRVRKPSVLKNLSTVSLSNNQINFDNKNENVNKKLLKFLLQFYRLAPNLKVFLYDQQNGFKLQIGGMTTTTTTTIAIAAESQEKPVTTSAAANIDIDADLEEFLNEYANEHELLINSLQVVNLSNNNLYTIPDILFKMNNLKEIYLNGNYIQKIPSNLLHVTRTISFIENPKQGAAASAPTTTTEVTTITQMPSIETKTTSAATASAAPATEIVKLPPIIQNIETLELNDNKLEQVPENLFIHFKNLKNLKLRNNPLREPPKDAICATYVDSGVKLNSNENSSNLWNAGITDEYENEIFNNLIDASNESINMNDDSKLGPMRSYMIKYKKREEMLLVNMFAAIKDEIDSQETLLKLMRRLKMPMDKVEIVCNEIAENIKLNWTKRLDKTQLRLKKQELLKVQREYILRIQTWKLLNIWRQLYGIDAHSDELLRVLKLMNSNEHEEALLNKVKSIKFYSSAIKI